MKGATKHIEECPYCERYISLYLDVVTDDNRDRVTVDYRLKKINE